MFSLEMFPSKIKGSSLTFFWDWIHGALEYLGLRAKSGKLLFLGLDNTGKTSLLRRLVTGDMEQHVPTLHPTSEEVQLGSIRLTFIFIDYLSRRINVKDCQKTIFLEKM